MPAGLRVTLQRSNYRQLPQFIDLARQLGARQVSFLAVDVANPHAFGRNDDFSSNLALCNEDLNELEQILGAVEHDYAARLPLGIHSGEPAQAATHSPVFRRRVWQRDVPARALQRAEISAVIDAKGRLSPCFFISGPADARWRDDLARRSTPTRWSACARIFVPVIVPNAPMRVLAVA